MSPPHIPLFLFLLSSIPISLQAAYLLPIHKHHGTRQYVTTIYLKIPLQPTNLVLDLGASFTWVDCYTNYNSTSYSHIFCGTPLCDSFDSRACGYCYEAPAPGCANNTCDMFPENSVTRQADLRNSIVDSLALPSTDGSTQGPLALLSNYIFSCAKSTLLKGLAKSSGMAALGRSNISLQAQVIKGFNSPSNVFAICLPGSSKSTGVGFIGSAGPYNFLPGMDVSKSLTYTPLAINPVGLTIINYNHPSDEYFVNLTSIKVNGEAVNLNHTLLTIDPESGSGGTKISTVVPFTTMQTSLYKAFTSAFLKEAAAMNLTLVSKSIKPFSYCYRADGMTSTRVGPAVPTIDLGMQNGVYWRVFGSNSMFFLTKEKVGYYCLGFMDGGANPKTSIVIGGQQLEDNLLQFDLGGNPRFCSSGLRVLISTSLKIISLHLRCCYEIVVQLLCVLLRIIKRGCNNQSPVPILIWCVCGNGVALPCRSNESKFLCVMTTLERFYESRFKIWVGVEHTYYTYFREMGFSSIFVFFEISTMLPYILFFLPR